MFGQLFQEWDPAPQITASIFSCFRVRAILSFAPAAMEAKIHIELYRIHPGESVHQFPRTIEYAAGLGIVGDRWVIKRTLAPLPTVSNLRSSRNLSGETFTYAAVSSSLTFRSVGSNPLARVNACRTPWRSQRSLRSLANCMEGISVKACSTTRFRT
jgi:hypothetical protein